MSKFSPSEKTLTSGEIRAIAEEIWVNLKGEHRHTDSQIADAVMSCLKWHLGVPSDLLATVQNARVTLGGKSAGSDGVPRRASRPIAIKHAIEKALKHCARNDAERVNVSANGGKFNLSVTIRAWDERNSTRASNWSSPDLLQVDESLAAQ